MVWASSQYNTFLQALFISAEKQRVLNETLSTAAGTALKEKERIDRIVASKQVGWLVGWLVGWSVGLVVAVGFVAVRLVW